MNSMSKYHKNEENKTHDENTACYDSCKHPAPGKSLLRCSNGGFSSTDITFVAANTPLTLNRPIASVSIDTTCLCRPSILIDFAGILTGTPITVTAVALFNFTLFKTCKGMRVRIPVATFSYSFLNVFTLPDSRTLKFEYSSCDDLCEDCCTYTLELTSISNIAPGVVNFSITGKLCALAIENPLNKS